MAESSICQLSFIEPDIARITIDDPDKGANVLSRGVLEQFNGLLDELQQRDGLAGLVIRSGKPGSFIAGADVREFAAGIDLPESEVVDFCRLGQQLFRRLSQMDFVTLAAVDGLCLGGGAEVAIWCDRRIMTTDAKTQIGFPEVKLGLFPGWGGTARTPRMIGLGSAVEMITSGESVDAKTAQTMGLANDLVAGPDALEAAAVAMIRDEKETGVYLQDRQRWSAPITISSTELQFLGATASAYIQQQTKGQYPAPLAALELLLTATEVDVDQACQMEAEAFAKLFGSPVNRSLIHIFFLQDQNKKDSGVDARGIRPQPVKSVAVIGAGIMGQGIAAANVKRRLPVTINDVSEAAMAQAVQSVLEEVSYNKAVKGPDAQRAVQFAPLIDASGSFDEIAGSDMVIEAVVENPDVKRELFAKLEPVLRDDAILASNTSTIPISRLAADLKHPERFCGIHFFNPVRKMPLVEVIRGEKTSDQAVVTAVAYAKSLGKSPIVVEDGPGFLVNRLLGPYMNEALELLQEGADISSVDRAAKAFGMPMGPITLFDVVGIDTAVNAGRVMYEAFPDRVVASELLTAILKRGLLGEKSGKGFFSYDARGRRGRVHPEAEQIIGERLKKSQSLTRDELTMRLFLPMFVEATRVLEDKLVRRPQDIDLGLVFGVGFPPSKGGLLLWADTLGAKKIVELLKPYESLGKRYQPTELLLEMSKEDRRFYEGA